MSEPIISRFKLILKRLRVADHKGNNIFLDTQFKKNSFRYKGKIVTYSATDGGNPSTATFTKAGRKWGELILGFEELTWGRFMQELNVIDGELSYLILETTMVIVFKEIRVETVGGIVNKTKGDTITCRFTIKA
jgi:hypothetical protein